ncbi:tetratricopeptide repeat protein [bacterium]|nr:tetratricopeptide repeat protein [bacterium]
MAVFHCPGCGRAIPFSPRDAGREGTCPDCRGRVRAPELAPIAETALEAAEAPTRPALAARASAPRTVSDRPASAGACADPGLAAEVERARADPARRFGPFLLLSELGKGGMGVVYRAWNDRLRRVVALKTILPGEGVDEAAVARFKREAEAAARLRHPGIVSVHEAGEFEGRHYMAMDYVPGRSLEARLRPGAERIAFHRALEVVRDVARAAHYAHSQGVVHRDLKPQNIIIDASERPFVLDFGLAAIKGAGTRLTKTGASMGTPAYMPPEQANGEAADERADVYSLGATLYHVLTGRPPFSGETDVNMIVAVLTKEPVPPGKINARASGDLETICLKCLEKDKARRYPSALALADELDRFLAGDPIEARPIGPLQRFARRARRNKVSTALAALAVALVVALGVVALATARGTRNALVRAARGNAEGRWEALQKARRDTPKLSSDVEAAARQARLVPVLAKALDAREAAVSLALVSDDADARARLFDTAFALGEVALEAEQWDLAASAFARAGELHMDDAHDSRARTALDVVANARTEVERDHRLRVEAILDAARRGRLKDLGGSNGALFALVRFPEPQTVALIVSELDAITARLRRVTHAAYLDARTPRVEAAVSAWDRLRPGAALEQAVGSDLSLAEREVEGREVDERRGRSEKPRPFRQIVAARQGGELQADGAVLAVIACEALGWIRLSKGPAGEEAVEALGRYVFADEDGSRAAPAAIALCQLGTDRAVALVEAARMRFGADSDFWRQVHRFYARTPGHEDGEPSSAIEYCERGERRYQKRDLAGAIADFTKALDRDQLLVVAWNSRGIAWQEKGDFDHAIADLTKALEIDPRSPVPWANLALARRSKGDFERAIADFDKAIALDPRSANLMVGRGGAHLDKGNVDRAIADYEKALELDPRSVSAWACLGTARREKGEIPPAIAALDKAIELDPRFAYAWTERARARAMKGDASGAISDYGMAIDLDPLMSAPWTNRGKAKREAGDLDGAIADFTKAIALDPRGAIAHHNRGVARWAKSDLDGAFADASTAIELDPSYAPAWAVRGNVRAEKRDLDGAIADYGKAIDCDKRLAPAWSARALARQKKGDLDAAISDFTTALELEPGVAHTWCSRGAARRENGDLDGAISDFAKAIELDPRDPRFWNNRAGARVAKGDLEGGIEDSTKAIELDPRDGRLWCARGDARQRKGDLQAALPDYAKALEIDPRNALLWSNRGTARKAAGDFDGALADYEKALELDSRIAQIWCNRGAARQAKGDLDGAIADGTRAIELDPRLADAWGTRADARKAKGDLQGAIADYTRVVELKPGNGPAWLRRGNSRGQLGDLEGAIGDYTRAIEADPRNALAWANRGNTRRVRGDLDGALSDTTRAIELDAGCSHAWSVRGAIREAKGDHDGAIADFSRCVVLDPKNPESWFNRAVAKESQGKLDAAAEDYKRFLERSGAKRCADPDDRASFSMVATRDHERLSRCRGREPAKI